MQDDSDTQASSALVVRRLTKSYGAVKAIDNISFRVAKGEILGFLGPNGAGKSTTMRIIAGLSQATSGTVDVCGISVALYPDKAKRHIGFMPENNPLPEDVRVLEYLRYRARLKGLSGRRLDERVDEVMDICQLRHKAARKIIGNLSKGFRQRVGIADAILAEPDLIIMDEPTIGLDPHQIIAIRELIKSLRGRMAVIISSHILPEIELVCDRAIIINQGSVVASGSPEALRNEFLPMNRHKVSLKLSPEKFGERLKKVLPKADFSLEEDTSGADGYYRYMVKTPLGENAGQTLVEEFSSTPECALREVSLDKPSLEEVFMAATRRSWEQVMKKPAKE